MEAALLTHLLAKKAKADRAEMQDLHERRMSEQEPTQLVYRGVAYIPVNR